MRSFRFEGVMNEPYFLLLRKIRCQFGDNKYIRALSLTRVGMVLPPEGLHHVPWR